MLVRYFLFLFCLGNVCYLNAQKLQGGLKVNYGYSLMSESNSSYDPATMSVNGMYTPGFSVQLNYSLNNSLELASGIGFQYRKVLFEHHKIHFTGVSTGSLYVRAKFGAIDIPFLARYKIAVGKSSLIITSVGVIGSLYRINATAVGYKELQYEGTDSLFYEVYGGGSFVRRFSADPYAGIGFEKMKEGYKWFGFSVFYQYTPVRIPTIEYHSTFSNSTEAKSFDGILNGNLSYVGVSAIYYPSFLTFRKVPEDDAYDEEE